MHIRTNFDHSRRRPFHESFIDSYPYRHEGTREDSPAHNHRHRSRRDDLPHRRRHDSRDDSPHRHHDRGNDSPDHRYTHRHSPDRHRTPRPETRVDRSPDLAILPLLRASHADQFTLPQPPTQLTPQSNKQEEMEYLLMMTIQHDKKIINETLLEKIAKSKVVKEHIDNNAMPISLNRSTSSNTYSQNIILDKINSHLTDTNQPMISLAGHCHGISILWLTMMHWGLESLFYKMIKQIADCPADNLDSIHDCIMTFLDWIDLGQNPRSYSNNQFGQRDVASIIGGVTQVASIEKDISQDMLALLINEVEGENHMICLAGKGHLRSSNKRGGHTIGLFTRKLADGVFSYSIFDSNYTDNKHRTFNSANEAANECWDRACAPLVPQKNQTIELDVVTVDQPMPYLAPLNPISSLSSTSGSARRGFFDTKVVSEGSCLPTANVFTQKNYC